MKVGIVLDRKTLIATITKYHDYKRFIHTSSIEEAEEQLSKLPRYGTRRAVLEAEINFHGFMSKVESIASRLTGGDATMLQQLINLNTTRRLSTAEMAKEIGVSDYKLAKCLDSISEELNAVLRNNQKQT